MAKLTGEAQHAIPVFDAHNTSFSVPPNQTSLLVPHTKALIKKRLNYMRRDRKSIFCEVVLPCLTVLGGLIMVSTASTESLASLTIGPSLFGFPITYMYTANTSLSWITPEANMYYLPLNNTMNLTASLQATDLQYYNNRSNGIGWYAISSMTNYSMFADT